MSGSAQKPKYFGLRWMSVLVSGAELVRSHTQVRFVPNPKVAEQKKEPPEGSSYIQF